MELERRVYVAGKYTEDNLRGVQENIKLANHYGRIIARNNIKVYVPHQATALWEGVNDYNYFFDLHLSVLDKWATDLFLLPNWLDSKGAIRERQYGFEHGKKVWYPDMFKEMIEHLKR